jgi:hypothetical protein
MQRRTFITPPWRRGRLGVTLVTLAIISYQTPDNLPRRPREAKGLDRVSSPFVEVT